MNNPKVNRHLDDKALDHIDHALGRPAWPLLESYRNCFAAGEGSEEATAFAASPHWRQGGTASGLTYFCVTNEGRAALAAHLASIRADRVYVVTLDGHDSLVPAATPAKARYDYFLTVGDCLPDVSFLEFVQRTRVRLAKAPVQRARVFDTEGA